MFEIVTLVLLIGTVEELRKPDYVWAALFAMLAALFACISVAL